MMPALVPLRFVLPVTHQGRQARQKSHYEEHRRGNLHPTQTQDYRSPSGEYAQAASCRKGKSCCPFCHCDPIHFGLLLSEREAELSPFSVHCPRSCISPESPGVV